MKRAVLCGLTFLVLFGANANAALVTYTTGDLGNNVINDSGNFLINPVLTTPSNVLLAEIEIKYGLWNSPDVLADVIVNGNLVGSFLADQGYISPGPEFVTFNVTGLLLNGINSVLITGNNANSGDYVVGQVDIRYDNSGSSGPAVPEPASLSLAGLGFLGVLGLRRHKKA